MAGTLRNLRATATAEVSNLERGMRRAAQATRQVGTAAEETSRRGSGAFDRLGRQSRLTWSVLGRGAREASVGLLHLADVTGGTASKVGGLLSMMVGGFASGGLIGAGIGAITGAIGLLGASSEEARRKQEALRQEQERAAEAAKATTERIREEVQERARRIEKIKDETALLRARNEDERRAVLRDQELRDARRQGPGQEAAVAEKQHAETLKRVREEQADKEKAFADALEAAAAKRAEAEIRAAQAERERVRGLREQLRIAFDALTLTEEQAAAKREQALIQDALNAGLKEEVEALKQAKQFATDKKAVEDRVRKEREVADQIKQQSDEHQKLERSADEQVAALRDQLALLKATTAQERIREERWQRQVAIVEQFGTMSFRVLRAQRAIWAEEDAQEAKRARAAAAAARLRVTPADTGRPTATLAEYDPASGIGPKQFLRDQERAQRQYDRNVRDFRSLQRERRGTSRTARGGEFAELLPVLARRRRREDEAEAQAGGGVGEPAPGGRPGVGEGTSPTMPEFPAIQEVTGEMQESLSDTASATKRSAEALKAIQPAAREAADGAMQTADAAGELKSPVEDLVSNLTQAVEEIGGVRSAAAEAAAGAGKVVGAVNDLKAEMQRLRDALNQITAAA